MQERLQKILAAAGIDSRRNAENLIKEGRIAVNGKLVTEMGVKADIMKDKITLDGTPLKKPRLVYYAFYKPIGVITALKDPEKRKTVADFTHGINDRVFPVGRLDFMAEGLLLLTNDGELANLLMHPRYAIPKKYHVKVRGVPKPELIAKLETGIRLEDGKTAPAEIEIIKKTDTNSWWEIIVVEGRNHLVKRMFEKIRNPVLKLIRVEEGGIKLGAMKPGDVRPLTKAEIQHLVKIKKNLAD